MEYIVMNIERYCALHGETPKSFEKLCGLANASVARWKKGVAMPTLRTMEKIESATHIPISNWLKENGIEGIEK